MLEKNSFLVILLCVSAVADSVVIPDESNCNESIITDIASKDAQVSQSVANVVNQLVECVWKDWVYGQRRKYGKANAGIAEFALDKNLEEELLSNDSSSFVMNLYFGLRKVEQNNGPDEFVQVEDKPGKPPVLTLNMPLFDAHVEKYLIEPCKLYRQAFDPLIRQESSAENKGKTEFVDCNNDTYYKVVSRFRMCDLILKNESSWKSKLGKRFISY